MTRRAFAPGTIKKRCHELTLWIGHVGSRWPTAGVDDVESWLDGRSLNARSRYATLSHLHRFYRFAIREGHTLSDPTVTIDRPRLPHALPRPVVLLDVNDAVARADEWTRLVLCLMADAGLRCCEVVALRWPDVDMAAGTMYVSGKGCRDRIVAIPERLRLQLYLAASDRSGPATPVIGRVRTPARLSQIIAKYFRSIGMTYTAHQLRHTYATRLYAATGGDLLAVRDALGHSSVATTQVYTYLNPRVSLEAGWRLTE